VDLAVYHPPSSVGILDTHPMVTLLSLGEEQTVSGTSDSNAEEVM
jgi:hypothetical protein